MLLLLFYINHNQNLCLQRKQPKGKGKAQTDGVVASQNTNAETSQNGVASQCPVMVDASQEPVVVDASQPTEDLFDDLPDEVIASIEEVMETDVQEPVMVDASQEPVVVDASQEPVVVDASQPTEDLFDDLPDEVIASIEEVMETDVQQQKAVKKMKVVKIEKPKVVKNKPIGQQVLYHGQKRRSSERIQLNAFKNPIAGIGSSDGQPIVIKDADEGVLTQDDSSKNK
ncbi:hypothetical protein QL285_039424 [Trifolium repens]|nr:hypothetical protein QL285_039424 [Trifolium repens]